jgi:nitroimidazol reductase NimA-like FMN-containing flavoprotein (pyridoxamine 5'-phosphate oxidase superfamily)
MNSSIRTTVEEVIRGGTIGALASTGVDGPGVCTVFYVWLRDDRFAFKSRRASHHMVNLANDPRTALAVYDHESNYHAKRGVQLAGTVREIPAVEEMTDVVGAYCERFPGAEKKLGRPETLIGASVGSTFFVVEVATFRLVDEGPDGNATMLEMAPWLWPQAK